MKKRIVRSDGIVTKEAIAQVEERLESDDGPESLSEELDEREPLLQRMIRKEVLCCIGRIASARGMSADESSHLLCTLHLLSIRIAQVVLRSCRELLDFDESSGRAP